MRADDWEMNLVRRSENKALVALQLHVPERNLLTPGPSSRREPMRDFPRLSHKPKVRCRMHNSPSLHHVLNINWSNSTAKPYPLSNPPVVFRKFLRLSTLTYDFRDFPQSLQLNVEITPQIGPLLIVQRSCIRHYIAWRSLNKPQINKWNLKSFLDCNLCQPNEKPIL
jgi:hypothetical protein